MDILPNHQLDDSVIIASTVMPHPPGDNRWLVIVLETSPPYYAVAEILNNGDVNEHGTHTELPDAVEQYLKIQGVGLRQEVTNVLHRRGLCQRPNGTCNQFCGSVADDLMPTIDAYLAARAERKVF